MDFAQRGPYLFIFQVYYYNVTIIVKFIVGGIEFIMSSISLIGLKSVDFTSRYKSILR